MEYYEFINAQNKAYLESARDAILRIDFLKSIVRTQTQYKGKITDDVETVFKIFRKWQNLFDQYTSVEYFNAERDLDFVQHEKLDLEL